MHLPNASHRPSGSLMVCAGTFGHTCTKAMLRPRTYCPSPLVMASGMLCAWPRATRTYTHKHTHTYIFSNSITISCLPNLSFDFTFLIFLLCLVGRSWDVGLSGPVIFFACVLVASCNGSCGCSCLSIYLSIYLSTYLPIYLSIYLSIYLQNLSVYLQSWKRNSSTRLTYFLNWTKSKKNAASLRDFNNFRLEHQKRSDSRWKVGCRADGLVPMRFKIFRSMLPRKQAPRNATPLRKSASWPPTISDEHVSCTCACHTKLIFEHATKPSRFAHFWHGAHFLCSCRARRRLNVQKRSEQIVF